jgi:hypothetical protein
VPIRLLLSHSHATPPVFARTIESSRLLPPTRILCSCSLRDLDKISLLPRVPAAAPESPYVYLLPISQPFSVLLPLSRTRPANSRTKSKMALLDGGRCPQRRRDTNNCCKLLDNVARSQWQPRRLGGDITVRKLAEEAARSLSERILTLQHDERRRIFLPQPSILPSKFLCSPQHNYQFWRTATDHCQLPDSRT